MKKGNILLILLGLMIIAFIFDNDIVLLANSIKNSYLDGFFDWVTNIGSTIVIMVVMTSFFLWETRKREWIVPLWTSFLASGLVTLILKLLFMRTRPFEAMNLGVSLVFPGWNTSFPSWHAAAAFAGLAILDKEFPRFKWFWILFAGLVAFSRIYIGAHYLSDVFAGIIIGYGLGLAMFSIENKYRWLRNFGRKLA